MVTSITKVTVVMINMMTKIRMTIAITKKATVTTIMATTQPLI